jgi:site-specific recombinase XerD
VTHLRKITLEELERRNYSETTTRAYLHAIEDFACYFKRPPDQLGPEEIREFTAHMFRVRKLADNTVGQRVAALRFFFTKTLRRSWNIEETPYPKKRIQLPIILSQDEVASLIEAASSPFHHTILMTLYGTGVRRAELTNLKITDVDSQRMVVHVQGGKGRKDRDIMLSPNLLTELREHYRSLRRKPETWLFPGGQVAYGRLSHRRQGRLVRLPRGRPTRQYPETIASAYPEALLRHSFARGRHRPAHHSDAARPQQPQRDHGLPARVTAASPRSRQSPGCTCNIPQPQSSRRS